MTWTSKRRNQNSCITAGGCTWCTSKPRTARLGHPTPTSSSCCHTRGRCVGYLGQVPDNERALNAIQRTFQDVCNDVFAAALPCMCTHCHVLRWPACVPCVPAGMVGTTGSMRWCTQKTSPNAFGSHHSKLLLSKSSVPLRYGLTGATLVALLGKSAAVPS